MITRRGLMAKCVFTSATAARIFGSSCWDPSRRRLGPTPKWRCSCGAPPEPPHSGLPGRRLRSRAATRGGSRACGSTSHTKVGRRPGNRPGSLRRPGACWGCRRAVRSAWSEATARRLAGPAGPETVHPPVEDQAAGFGVRPRLRAPRRRSASIPIRSRHCRVAGSASVAGRRGVHGREYHVAEPRSHRGSNLNLGARACVSGSGESAPALRGRTRSAGPSSSPPGTRSPASRDHRAARSSNHRSPAPCPMSRRGTTDGSNR
jgi:hypothetical protein